MGDRHRQETKSIEGVTPGSGELPIREGMQAEMDVSVGMEVDCYCFQMSLLTALFPLPAHHPPGPGAALLTAKLQEGTREGDRAPCVEEATQLQAEEVGPFLTWLLCCPGPGGMYQYKRTSST